MNAFVVVLTFVMLGHANGGTTQWRIACPNVACVENIKAHAGESPNLQRLRVFSIPGDAAPLPGLGTQTIFPPDEDLWFF